MSRTRRLESPAPKRRSDRWIRRIATSARSFALIWASDTSRPVVRKTASTARCFSSPATFGIAVGGALSENNILAFHVWDVVATNPTISAGGSTFRNADATVTLIAFGPEYTVYTKDNIYFALTPSLTRGTLSTSGRSSDTNWGFGLRGAVGKEWWVGDHLGLGVAGHLSFYHAEPAPAALQPVETAVARDDQHPSLAARLAGKAREALERVHEGGLRHIF